MKCLNVFILAVFIIFSLHYGASQRQTTTGVVPKYNGDAGCKQKSGRWLHKDECNWCFCDSGHAMCTVMHCLKKKKLISDVESCKNKPQGKFKSEDSCNWCFCIDHNTPVCTQMQCFKPNKLRQKTKKQVNKALADSSKICEIPNRKPGKLLHKDNCNWCFCIGSKMLMCTIMGCPKPVSPGSNKKNKLSVNNVKETVDSMMPGITALSAKEKKPKSLKEMAQACKAGSKFKDPLGCNWCDCIEDGVVVCEQNDCQPD